MTILIAAIRNGEAVIGADTRVTKGDRIVKTSKSFSKLFQTPGFVVGVAGFHKIHNVAKEVFGGKLPIDKKWMAMRTERHAIQLAEELHARLKESMGEAGTVNAEVSKDDLHTEVLILTEKRIFKVDAYQCCTESDSFEAVGSGEVVALGALSALYHQTQLPLISIVEQSLKTACDLVVTCGEPLSLVKL